MGCTLSKIDSELVDLCRERKDLIKAARDSQRSLASTHMTCFESLQGLENAVSDFVDEALVACADAGPDHQIVEEVLLSEGSNGDFDGNDDDDDHNDASAFTDFVNGGSVSLGPQPENTSEQMQLFGDFVLPAYWNGIPVGDLRHAVASWACDFAANHERNLLPNSESDEDVYEHLSDAAAREVVYPDSSRDLHEALNDIKETLDGIKMHGKDVLQLLGPYQQGIPLNNGSDSCIRSSTIAIETSGSVWRMLKRSAHKISLMANDGSENFDNETSTTLCNLSLTLEKLCIWENKLYREVKGEEKLRENYNKECRKLAQLDDRGAEPSKFEAVQLSLKRLKAKVNVAMSMVEGIAIRTHRLRDEELQPQLCELIQRMHKMWKFLFEAHEKQLHAMIKGQANLKITCTTADSSLKAAQKLEVGIQKLGRAFTDWIQGHKSFPSLLKSWLAKFLIQDSSSPSNLSKLEVCTLCNEWLSAVERVSEADVLWALNNFKVLVQHLWQSLQEEKQHRVKMEYLSRYHETKLKKFCSLNGLDWGEYASLTRGAESGTTIETGNRSLDELHTNLRPIRIKIDEATEKQEDAMKEVNVAVAEIIEKGLVPAIAALGNFSSDMLRAYEQIGVLYEDSTQ